MQIQRIKFKDKKVIQRKEIEKKHNAFLSICFTFLVFQIGTFTCHILTIIAWLLNPIVTLVPFFFFLSVYKYAFKF